MIDHVLTKWLTSPWIMLTCYGKKKPFHHKQVLYHRIYNCLDNIKEYRSGFYF